MLSANGFGPHFGPRPITPEVMQTLAAELEPIVSPGFVCRFIGGEGQQLVNEFVGVKGFADAWTDWLETFESFELHAVQDFLDGKDCIVTVGRQRGTSAMAGIDIDVEALSVWHLEGDRVNSAEFYLERGPAMRAAGLA